MRSQKFYDLGTLKAQAIASSTNASPIVVTANAHGLVTGDRITIQGHETNTAANGTWNITKVNDNSFSLDDSTGNGVGGATGTIGTFIKSILVDDFRHLLAAFASDATGAMTIKCVGSISDECPDFAATRSPSNLYEYINMIDKQAFTGVDGDTGFAFAASADVRQFEVNTNGLRWLGFVITTGTAGSVKAIARIFNDEQC